MASRNHWQFASYEDLRSKWQRGNFDCDDIGDFTDPLVLDWVSRLEDWAPKVALCFNRNTTPVTLDRISQHEMSELRRLVCFHQNCSIETLERLLEDSDPSTRDSALEQLERRIKGYSASNRRRVRA